LDLNPTKGLEKTLAITTLNTYRTLFRDQTNKTKTIVDLTNKSDCNLYLFKMLTSLVGKAVVRDKCFMKNGVRERNIIVDEEEKLFHEKIYEFRKPFETKGMFLGEL